MIEPIIAIVLISALVSAMNPYSIGVLTLLSAVVYGRGHSTAKVLRLGSAYTVTLFATAVIGGALTLYLFSLLPLIALNYMVLGIGILVVCAGLLEIKDFFWYGQGISMRAPTIAARNISALTKSHPSIGSAVLLGLFVAVASAPSASASYFATITMLRGDFSVSAISLLVLYSSIFALPMVTILLMIGSGVKVSTLMRWKEQVKGHMRLGVGLLLIALGWILILMGGSLINFG